MLEKNSNTSAKSTALKALPEGFMEILKTQFKKEAETVLTEERNKGDFDPIKIDKFIKELTDRIETSNSFKLALLEALKNSTR